MTEPDYKQILKNLDTISQLSLEEVKTLQGLLYKRANEIKRKEPEYHILNDPDNIRVLKRKVIESMTPRVEYLISVNQEAATDQMITLNFKIELPIDNFKNFYFISGKPPLKHKFWEFEINRDNILFGFDFRYTIKTDHAGLWSSISLFFITFNFQIYDRRHWDVENDEWAKH